MPSFISAVGRAAGIAPLVQDRVLFPDIRAAVRLVRGGELLRAARAATGVIEGRG
jgi:hypothetical protein